MYRGIKIAAVIPAHNESAHIKDVIVGMPDIVDIIAITDDMSTDNTAEIAESTNDDRVTVTRHKKNTGVGGAIITAHEVALSQGSQINVVFAGDNQMDPNYLLELLEPVIEGKYGYSKGNRLFSRTSHDGMPKYRIFGNYVLSYMHKCVGGYWNISDPQNGYTAIRTDVLQDIDYKSISKGYEFENDMLTRLNENDIPVADVSIPALYRDEVSGIDLKKVIPALLKNFVVSYSARLYRKYIKRKQILPTSIIALGAMSAISMIVGVVTLNSVVFFGSLAIAIGAFVGISLYDYKRVPKPWNPSKNIK